MKKSIIATLFIMMITMFIISCEKTTEPENNDSEFATVTINLSTNNNGSVNGAVVKLQHNTDTSSSQQKTATSSVVKFTGVEHGTYTLIVTHTGYSTYTNTNLSVQSAIVNQNVNITAVLYTATVNINLSTGNSGSVNGAVVKLQHNTNSGISQQKTATSEMVSFTSMEYGTYTLTVTHAGYYVYSNSSLSVQSESVSQNVSLNEIPKATVNINLSTGNSGSVSGAVVKLQHNTNSNVSQQKTASGNLVSFTGVDYGSYTLTVTHSGYFIYSNTNLSVQSETVSQSVTLKDTYEIGETGPAGGIIFWDKGYVSDGWRYLEAAPATSEFNAEWGAYGTDVTGTGTMVGTGKANTQIINNKLQELGEVGRASQRCAALSIGGFKDWFLPSKDELDLMYKNLKAKGLGGFSNSYYWSSSQYNVNNNVWGQDFSDGHQGDYLYKNRTHSVRAVRAF